MLHNSVAACVPCLALLSLRNYDGGEGPTRVCIVRAALLLFIGRRVAASQQPLASLPCYCRADRIPIRSAGQVVLELGSGLPVFIVLLACLITGWEACILRSERFSRVFCHNFYCAPRMRQWLDNSRTATVQRYKRMPKAPMRFNESKAPVLLSSTVLC